jgi:(p)ppGpp synthase/HD superfamily hydrolase
MVKPSHLRVVHDDEAALGAWLATARTRMAPAAFDTVANALELAAPIYAHHTLPGGERLLAHALATADTLLQLELDPETAAAGLTFRCLDIAPDCADRLRTRLGRTVTELAEGVLRMAQIGALSSRQPGQRAAVELESLAKMPCHGAGRAVVLIRLAVVLELRSAVRTTDEPLRRRSPS